MAPFRYGCGTGADWRTATDACLAQLGSGGDVGFLYVTDRLADHLAEILARCKSATGAGHWVGTVGLGVCATGQEYMDTPAVVAMAGEFEAGSYSVFGVPDGTKALDTLKLACGEAPAAFALVHANPHCADVEDVVAAVAGKVESGFLIGGLTSSRGRNLQVADGVLEGPVSGIAFADSVVVATRLTQGCTPVGPRHVITSAQRNVVMTLDGRPALEVLKEDIGEETAEELARLGGTIFAGLAVAGSDTGDYIVRHLIGIDPANQLIAVGDMVKTGGQVLFCRRDRETARDDMARMLKSIREGLYARPRGAVYYSCLGRGKALFGEDSGELEMIRDTLGHFPLVGFFCNGEISHNRLYGYTGVLTLFV
jgi:small ligand-binding sensory domain FIST